MKIFERAMLMDEAAWRRHANPLSVYTRYSALPLLGLAVWSRVWLGWWAIAPVAIALAWIWINPRLFPEPVSTGNWASKSVLGERVWLNRKNVPIPPGHMRAAMLLSVLNGLASLVAIYGLVVLDLFAAVSGTVAVILAKTWFLDRMVWLYETMARDNETYRRWQY